MVALAKLASVVSRLVSLIWRGVSSLAGVVGCVFLGREDCVRGLFRKRERMWALARMDSSWWESLAGCMYVRYARHSPSIEHSESWLEGKAF